MRASSLISSLANSISKWLLRLLKLKPTVIELSAKLPEMTMVVVDVDEVAEEAEEVEAEAEGTRSPT
jgi:hypothetical protein